MRGAGAVPGTVESAWAANQAGVFYARRAAAHRGIVSALMQEAAALAVEQEDHEQHQSP
jgi:hypothetical protein